MSVKFDRNGTREENSLDSGEVVDENQLSLF